MTLIQTTRLLALSAALCGAIAAQAQVQIKDAWARATVAQQKATGVFMHLSAERELRLVAVSTPIAGIAEVHEMKLEGDVMKMRALSALTLPAGQSVVLQPGGRHVMLMDLKQPLPAGSEFTLTLTFEGADGVRQSQQVRVTARALGAAGAGADHGKHQR